MAPNMLWFENNDARIDMKSIFYGHHMAPELRDFLLEAT